MRGLKEQIVIPSGQSFRLIRWAGNLGEVECVGPDGKSEALLGEGGRWHYHREMELTWFRKGRGTRFVGDGISSFRGGELVLLGSNVPHYWHVEGPCAGISIQWSFPRGHAFWGLPESAGLHGLFQSASRGLRYGGKEAATAGALMDGILEAEGIFRLGEFLRLLGILSGEGGGQGEAISAKSFSLAEGSGYRVSMERAVRHVILNFREVIRLENLLEITAMSRATFCRQFRVHTGRSFSEFLLGLRMETACRELLETDKTVTEVAYGCGFGQISFFNRSFRKIMGCTPTEFRKAVA